MNDLLKQTRRELLPLFDEIIKKLGGNPPASSLRTNSSGMRLVKQIRVEFRTRVEMIKSLVGTNPPATAPTPARRRSSPNPVAVTPNPPDANPDSK